MEIEGKYLLREDGKSYAKGSFSGIEELLSFVYEMGVPIEQGYLKEDVRDTLIGRLGIKIDFRVETARLRDEGGKFYFTLKGEGDVERAEENFRIDKGVFDEYWQFTNGRRVSKIRFKVPYQGFTAEVDFYTDRDLIVAEIEVQDKSELSKIDKIGLDVTHEMRYKNSHLAK